MLRGISKIVSVNRAFFLPYLTFLFFCSFALLLFDKEGLHIAINQKNHPFADVFFKYLTYLGDGRMLVVYALILLFIKYRFVLILLLSNLFSGVLTFILKTQVFDASLRPKKYFENIYELRLVPGVENYLHNSMPSGHTATAFCVFTGFALMSKNKYKGFLFLIISALIGFSRIYLSQHFLDDVFIGSLIGVLFALLVYYLFEKHVRNQGLEKALFKNNTP
jgi:membrane-associated phospholipid phosphatase